MEKETIDLAKMEDMQLLYSFIFYNYKPSPYFSLIAKSYEDIIIAKRENIKRQSEELKNNL